MRPILSSVVALGLFLGTAAVSHAGAVLYTAPTPLPSGSLIYCQASNLDSKDRDITLEIIGVTGTVVSTSSQSLAPGARASTSSSAALASYCRITFSGSRKNVRGAATVGTNIIPFVPQITLEAR